MCIICRNEYDPEATTINCSGCQTIVTLPNIPNVQELYCYNCPNLTALPDLPNMQRLSCSNCPNLTALPDLPNLQGLYCGNCPFLNHPRNPHFQTNLAKLCLLQKSIRRYYQRKKHVLRKTLLQATPTCPDVINYCILPYLTAF